MALGDEHLAIMPYLRACMCCQIWQHIQAQVSPSQTKQAVRLGAMRTLRVVFIAVLGAALVAAPAFGANAINFDNRPTVLAGKTNGELAIGAELTRATANCAVAKEAAPSLALMVAEAAKDGINLAQTECYRALSGQVAVSRSYTSAGNSACAATPAVAPGGKVVGTSMHGWGKAVDFRVDGNFSSSQYRWLKANAWKFGWNHPGFAEPGGSACPEAWHWEWVGDGGQQKANPVRADLNALLPTANSDGYVGVTGAGGVDTAGAAFNAGAMTGGINWPMVGAASTPSRNGYWMVAADGGIFTFGDAAFYGSTGSLRLNRPVVDMESTKSGNGYWSVASDGGIFTFGDAQFYGSTGAIRLNQPVVSMAMTPTGNGYWLVASDGGIFSFGDAKFFGSTGAIRLNEPIVAMTPTPTGNGYWLVASDGGVFAFGDAQYLGSTGAMPPTQPVVDIVATKSGQGYWIASAAGQIYSFGDARYFGGV